MNWSEPILHIDMDSFFVEVERLEDPRLKGRPVAVGGVGPRGVVASASYEAREFGVRSAQPTSVAKRLCPSLVVVPSSHGKYGDVSADVFRIFRDFTPKVEGLSLDEAFLDVGGLRRHFDTPEEVGYAIRAKIRSELGLPASVGIAGVKFVAKLASEDAKPDGLLWIAAEQQVDYLRTLDVGRMWGVGPATLAALHRLGVATIGDLADLDRTALVGAVGSATGSHLHELAHGRDPRAVEPDSKAKSISVEETFESDLEGVEVVTAALLGHSHRLSGRLRRAGLRGRTVTLKVRFSDFRTVSRSTTLQGSTDGSKMLYETATDLLEAVELTEPVRLLGLGVTSLESAAQPSQLDFDTNSEWEKVEDAIADVRERFGASSLRPARLARRPGDSDSGQEP